MIELIIPTLGEDVLRGAIRSLSHNPIPVRIHIIMEGNSWAEAVNIGLEEVYPGSDVILMDDDVRLLPETFEQFLGYTFRADIIGFKLLFPSGEIQHAGGYVNSERDFVGHLGHGCCDCEKWNAPYYVPHVTASLVYIKSKVLDTIGKFEETWPGIQFEDVDFSFRALKHDFRILYVPNPAVHLESRSKTRLLEDDFDDKLMMNLGYLREKHFKDRDFIKSLAKDYPRVMENEAESV